MTSEAQLIALFEWMGWTLKTETFHNTRTGYQWFRPDGRMCPGGGGIFGWGWQETKKSADMHLPTLTLDLMHEAEDKLEREKTSLCSEYALEIKYVIAPVPPVALVGDFRFLHATKEQRLESLLRVIGKWVNSKPASQSTVSASAQSQTAQS